MDNGATGSEPLTCSSPVPDPRLAAQHGQAEKKVDPFPPSFCFCFCFCFCLLAASLVRAQKGKGVIYFFVLTGKALPPEERHHKRIKRPRHFIYSCPCFLPAVPVRRTPQP